MRNNLRKINNERHRFYATFERYGSKATWTGNLQTTLLLKNVTNLDDSVVVADHLWFAETKGFAALGAIQAGARIVFNARSKSYSKGYVNYRQGIDESETDFKLANPTKIEIIKKEVK
jgi:hypothetical protein